MRHTTAWLALTLLTACATPDLQQADVEAILDEQREAWNAGDMEAFMGGYWKSEQLSFVGRSGLTQGYEETLANYLRGYPDAAARGTLTFELVEFRPVGQGAAVAVGKWHLQREEPAQGWFSLVLEDRPEGVRIVHDHSSSSDEP